jgi:hypothetical protein|tara:strand:- start:1611 stop:2003 length:393 start_codon:yes stop_codon:yes gene_type:complete
MAITSMSKGTNRSVEAATENFVVASSTAAATFIGKAKVPANATILGVSVKTNIAMAGGTNVTVKVGGASAVAVSAAILTATMTPALKQNTLISVAPLALTAAAVAEGNITITTVGTFTAGDIDVTIHYVV